MRKWVVILGVGLALMGLFASSAVLADDAAPMGAWGRMAGTDFSAVRGSGDDVGAAITGARTMIIRTRTNRFKFLNLDGPSFTAGDFDIFRETIYNRAGTKRLGHDLATCTFGFPRNLEALCKGTFTFTGRGDVQVDGVVAFGAGRLTLAVTGGTGEFANVRGEAEIIGGSDTDTVFELRLIP